MFRSTHRFFLALFLVSCWAQGGTSVSPADKSFGADFERMASLDDRLARTHLRILSITREVERNPAGDEESGSVWTWLPRKLKTINRRGQERMLSRLISEMEEGKKEYETLLVSLETRMQALFQRAIKEKAKLETMERIQALWNRLQKYRERAADFQAFNPSPPPERKLAVAGLVTLQDAGLAFLAVFAMAWFAWWRALRRGSLVSA